MCSFKNLSFYANKPVIFQILTVVLDNVVVLVVRLK